MKVVIPGGSGQVGTVLARALERDGHEVVTGTIGGGEPGAPDTWRFSIDLACRWPEAARALLREWREQRRA